MIAVLHQRHAHLHACWTIALAVAVPNLVNRLPIAANREDREPRPGSKMKPLQSAANPNVIATDAFNRARRFGRTTIAALERKRVPPIERNYGGIEPNHCRAFVIDHTKRNLGV